MARSAAYARIKADVFAIVRAIPAGRVTSFALLGNFLEVVPRQVAYLLALRNDLERETSPWHRVVGAEGALSTPKYDAYGTSQAVLLEGEGIAVDASGRVAHFDAHCFVPTTANTGVRPTPRPTRRASRSR